LIFKIKWKDFTKNQKANGDAQVVFFVELMSGSTTHKGVRYLETFTKTGGGMGRKRGMWRVKVRWWMGKLNDFEISFFKQHQEVVYSFFGLFGHQ